MKYLKILGLAAMAAMALMAFLGAGSASATTLCTTTVTPCPAGEWKYSTTNDNIIVASLETGTTAILKNTSGSIEDTCGNSSIEGNITNAGGAAATVAGKVTKIEFGECVNTTIPNNEAACTLEVHNIAGTDNGTLTGSGCTVTIQLFGVDCKFGVNEGTHMGIVTGGAMGTIDIKAVVRRNDGSSILCPETGLWEASYTVTKPAGALYVEPE